MLVTGDKDVSAHPTLQLLGYSGPRQRSLVGCFLLVLLARIDHAAKVYGNHRQEVLVLILVDSIWGVCAIQCILESHDADEMFEIKAVWLRVTVAELTDRTIG